MSEESTTPDLLGRVQRYVDASNAHDVDAVMSLFAPDAVWDMGEGSMSVVEGHAALREFFSEWLSVYEDFEVEANEIRDLGNGVTICSIDQRGRARGSSAFVGVRYATVWAWTDGLVTRTMSYPNIDEARAAAERLARERG
ncbi:MAG TPA: nuclear transport factor 2 family protein [Solirubrobacteraceae bacterium]|nr:nuclear transport factor 2 family protein [Solirubrobacteraceae bacterium]